MIRGRQCHGGAPALSCFYPEMHGEVAGRRRHDRGVALPYMQGSVSASQDQIDWVLTSYIVAVGNGCVERLTQTVIAARLPPSGARCAGITPPARRRRIARPGS